MKKYIQGMQWDDVWVVLVLTLFSPVFVVVIWLLDMADEKKYSMPWFAIKYVYRIIFQWWKEVLK
jgi:hypothetical protein